MASRDGIKAAMRAASRWAVVPLASVAMLAGCDQGPPGGMAGTNGMAPQPGGWGQPGAPQGGQPQGYPQTQVPPGYQQQPGQGYQAPPPGYQPAGSPQGMPGQPTGAPPRDQFMQQCVSQLPSEIAPLQLDPGSLARMCNCMYDGAVASPAVMQGDQRAAEQVAMQCFGSIGIGQPGAPGMAGGRYMSGLIGSARK